MSNLEDIYSDFSLSKGMKLEQADDGIRLDEDAADVYWVKGSGKSEYRVQKVGDGEDGEPAYLTCSCPNGVKRGGRPSCYHTAAVLLRIQKSTVDDPDLDDDAEPDYF